MEIAKNRLKQESIPVGCVASAAVAAGGGGCVFPCVCVCVSRWGCVSGGCDGNEGRITM